MGIESVGVRPVSAWVAVLGSVAVVLGWSGSWTTADDLWADVDAAEVRASVEPDFGTVRVVGLPDALLGRLARGGRGAALSEGIRLFPAGSPLDDPTFPSVTGTVSLDGGIDFRPTHLLVPDLAYEMVIDPDRLGLIRGGAPLVLKVDPRRVEATPAPAVLAVYPSADEMPANQLKMYVHFSRPMRTWDPYRHIRLVDEDTGEAVVDAFHAMRDGLWDARGMRLTVVFDPGRIKRGLANHEALGTPLREGGRYRLVIDTAWTDLAGAPLEAGWERTFRVGPPDRAAPDPTAWALDAPAAGARGPLRIRFDEAMDHAVLAGSMTVRGAAGWSVPGLGDVEAGEKSWAFMPDRTWAPGDYELVVERTVEDLAGNSLVRLFDVDLQTARDVGTNEGGRDALRIPFTVGADRSVAPR